LSLHDGTLPSCSQASPTGNVSVGSQQQHRLDEGVIELLDIA
jgi:hypothetical protein